MTELEERIIAIEKDIQDIKRVISTNAELQNKNNEEFHSDILKIIERLNTTTWW